MKRVLVCLALFFAPLAYGQIGAVQNHTFLGGTHATTSGLNSTNYLNGIIPSGTVTVYNSGTTTKAVLYGSPIGQGVGSVAQVVITAGGSYSVCPTSVTFTGGGGSGAAGTPVCTSGAVTSVTITAAGTGYTSAPSVGFSGGTGSGAAGTAYLAATLSNPFTSNTASSVNPGGYIFWAAAGQAYDVVGSGGIPPNTYPQPVTLLVGVYPTTAVSVGPSSPPQFQTNSVNNGSQTLVNFTDTSTVKASNPTGGVEEFTVVGSSTGNFSNYLSQPTSGQFVFIPATGFTPQDTTATGCSIGYPAGYTVPSSAGTVASMYARAGPCGNNTDPDSHGGTFTFTGALEAVGLTQAQVTAVYGTEVLSVGTIGSSQTVAASCGGSNLVLASGQALVDTASAFSFPTQQVTTANLGVATVDSLTCTTSDSHSFVNPGGTTNVNVGLAGAWVEYSGSPVTPNPTVNFASPLMWNASLNSVLLPLPYDWAPDTGTANTYVVSNPAYITPGQSYVPSPGTSLRFTPANANTAASTLNFNQFGAVAIDKNSGGNLVALSSGDLVTGEPAQLSYNGSVWILENPATGSVTASPQFQIPYYSASGTSNTLTGDAGMTTDGSGNATFASVKTNGGAGVGGTIDATEGTAATATAGHDILYADSTAHCLELSNNGAAFACIGSGGTGLSGMTAGQVPIAATATTVTSSKALAGTGVGITTGPTTTTLNDCVKFGDTAGTIADAGAACGSGGGGGAPGPYSYTFTVSGTLSLLTSGSGGSGYTGTPTCTLVGGQLVSGTADTCTVTNTSGVLSYSLSGTGVYSNPPTLTFTASTGTGAVAPPIGLGSETVNAYNNTTQSSTPAFTGTDTATVFNDVTSALAQTGGTLYFKPGWYNCNSPTAETVAPYTNVYYCFALPASGNGYNINTFNIVGESSSATNSGITSSTGGVTFYITAAAVTASGASGGANVIAGFWARKNTATWVPAPWTGLNFGAHVQINNVQILFPDNTVQNERGVMMLAASFTGLENDVAGFATYPTALGATHDIAFETNGSSSDGAILKNIYAETGWDIGYAVNTEHSYLVNDIAEEVTTGMEYGLEQGVNNQDIIHQSTWIHPILGETVHGIVFGPHVSAGAQLDMVTPDFETYSTSPWTTSSFIDATTALGGTMTDWICHNSGGGTACPSSSSPYSIFTSGNPSGYTIAEDGQMYAGGTISSPSPNTTAISGTTSTTGPAVSANIAGTGSANPVQSLCSATASGNSCYNFIKASSSSNIGILYGYKVGDTYPGFLEIAGSGEAITWNGNSVQIPSGSLSIPAGTLTLGGSTFNPAATIFSATGNWGFGTDFQLSNTSTGGHSWIQISEGSSETSGLFIFNDNTTSAYPLTLFSSSSTATKILSNKSGTFAFSSSDTPYNNGSAQQAGISSPGSAQISLDSTTQGDGLAKVTAAHYYAKGTPTIAAGTGAGTTPTISITGNDEAGYISLTTGTAPTASATIFTVTLANACTTGAIAEIKSANAAAAGLSGTTHEYISNPPAAGTWAAVSNTTGLSASTAYVWNYIVRCY